MVRTASARLAGMVALVAVSLVTASCAASKPSVAASTPRDSTTTVTTTTSTTSTTGSTTTGCPSHAAPLTADAVARASDAALAAAPTLYHGANTHGAFVTLAARSSAAGPQGKQIGLECGDTVAERSVVVELNLPGMLPSASLSQGTVFVALIGGRYQVWQLAH